MLTPAVALAAVSMGAMLFAAEIESGLPVGESPPAFNVKDITGPAQGTSLCYRCRYGNRPVVSIFAREVNEEVASLIKQIDGIVGANGDQDMAAFVVLLSEDADTAAPQLTTLAEEQKISDTPLTIFDGVAGPPSYSIAEDADITVMMWVGSEVKVNRG
jgi:hypothetical protein